MPRGKPSGKLALTVAPDVHEKVLPEALRRQAGLAAVAEWEKQHGALSEEEMKEARRRVGAQLRTSRRVGRLG